MEAIDKGEKFWEPNDDDGNPWLWIVVGLLLIIWIGC